MRSFGRSAGACALALSLAACNAPAPPLSRLQPARVHGATDVGPVDPALRIDLVLGLRVRHDAVAAHLRSQANPSSELFGRFLSPAEFGDRFAPAHDEYEQLIAWLGAHHLTVKRREPSRSSLTVFGTAADVESAFHVRLRNYRDKWGPFRAPQAEPLLEPSLANLLEGMVGLDDASGWFSHAHGAPPPPASPNATQHTQAPADLQALYGINQVPYHGEGETVGILGTGYAPSPTRDVAAFAKKYNLTFDRVAQYNLVQLDGPNRDSDGLATNEYFENVLDIDMVMGLAPAASVVHVMTSSNSPGLFDDGISFFINQVPQAHQVSVSYGTCEKQAGYDFQFLQAMFQQAKTQGQQWFFASGDDGTDTCKDMFAGGPLVIDWPASSPYVIGVGGTELDSNGGEVAWNDGVGLAGGGGQSELVDKPDYQKGVGPYPDDGVRDVPDVAAMAGSPGVVTLVSGQTSGAYGTSAASPMWAAVWALLDQSLGGVGVRNGHERLYELAGVGMHDITTGNISTVVPGFKAQAGYDLATGWGSPNVPQLINSWK